LNTPNHNISRGSAGERPAVSPPARRRIHIKQVDAFTEIPLTGNPAAVVVDASGLTDSEMQMIAREMAVPETAFILPARVKGTDLNLRWFTPTMEVPLCGHATVAGFHALAEEGLYGMAHDGVYRFSIETLSGVLPVTVEKSGDCVDVWLGLSPPSFVRAGVQKLDVVRILNVGFDELDSRLPMVADKDLFVPLRRLHTLFALRPNMFAVSQFLANRNFSGLCVFTTETVERSSSVHSRYFAPHQGIEEDPVTGSANGPLGVYLFENDLLGAQGEVVRPRRTAKKPAIAPSDVTKQVSLIAEQGDAIGRKGRVQVRLETSGSQVMSVSIGGKAVTVFDGELLVG
jgi:trans-2,3-dihydro-3-hydroxyanthranilate isomerase